MPKHSMPDTADTCLFGYESGWHVLFVRRRWEPYVNHWALPGGYLEPGKESETAARRELAEETNIACNDLRFVDHYREPGRDPRNLATDAFWGIVPGLRGPGGCPEPEPADDAADARWWNIHRLPRLAFDHADIVNAAIHQLHARHQETGHV